MGERDGLTLDRGNFTTLQEEILLQDKKKYTTKAKNETGKHCPDTDV